MGIVGLGVQSLAHDKHLVQVRHYHIKLKEKNVRVSVSFLFLLC